ncbi:MAG: MFS transporter [Clostridiales bacterium]|nr:MFS transporter [Clostridiales bacterium]
MKKITFKNKLGYGLGDFGNGLTFAMSASFLLAFYTDVLGITAMAAGILFFVARIWDAINDPMMGALTDRMFIKRMRKHKGKKVDKFRPFLVRGSFFVVAAAILMFIAPPSLVGTQKLVWAYITYILWGMAYTFINIPYGSLAAVMTQDPAERSSLSVARGLGGMFGNMTPAILVPIFLTKMGGEGQNPYLIAMIVMGAIAIVTYILAYFTTEENVVHEISEADSKISFKESFSVLKKNRPFIAVSLASVSMLTGLLVMGSMSLFYFRENLDALQFMSIAGLLRIVPMFILAPALTPLVKKFGTKNVVAYSSLISAVIFGGLFFLPNNVMLYMSISLIGSIFMTVPNMLVWGMVSDSIDYNQYLCGSRQEGVIYGSYSFVRKMGQALAGLLAGAGLTIVAYNSDLAVQTASTLTGIKFLTIGLPAIGMLIAFLAFKYIYDLTPEKQKEIIDTINAKSKKIG